MVTRSNRPERKEQRLAGVLKSVAPGTALREGLENIVSARTGALIVMGDISNVIKLCNGGFELNCPFSPQKLYELAKMDGAIILDEEIDRILLANVHLVPDSSLPTSETGMRHRTAQRVARQTKATVISISQRRDVVSLYIDEIKYVLADVRVIIAKANQALQALERYKARLNEVISNLNGLEFENLVTVTDVVTVLQRSEMAHRVAQEIEQYISELGSEGRLIDMQIEELMANVEMDILLVIRDYILNRKRPESVRSELGKLSGEHLLDPMRVCQLLGYDGEAFRILDKPAHPRGYRLLRKVPRLPMTVINKIINRFGNLQSVLDAEIEDLDEVDGVGKVRAEAIKDSLKRLKEHSLLERFI